MASVAASQDHPTGWRHLWRISAGTVVTFLDRDTSPRCAGAAFFGFLSFFPAIATVALIYGLVADLRLLAATVANLQFILPASALPILEEQLRNLATQPQSTLGIGLLVSIPLALWSGSRGVDALLYAMSQVRGQPERRGIILSLLVAIGLTVGGSIFVVVALVTIAGLPALIPFPSGDELILFTFRWPVLLVVTIGIFVLLYRFGPDRHPRKLRFVWPGAVLASLLWILAGAIFSIYVENWGNFDVTFGSVSAAVVLLLWMYNSAQILVLGAALNTQLERAATGQPSPRGDATDQGEPR
jgi:membrane protein